MMKRTGQKLGALHPIKRSLTREETVFKVIGKVFAIVLVLGAVFVATGLIAWLGVVVWRHV